MQIAFTTAVGILAGLVFVALGPIEVQPVAGRPRPPE